MSRCPGCPVSPSSACDCVAAYAQDCAVAFDAFLAPLQINVLTRDNVVSLEAACSGDSMICVCRTHSMEREQAIRRAEARGARQPWEAKAA